MSQRKFLLQKQTAFWAILLCLSLVSCAGSAPPMPEDTTGTNRQRTLSLSEFSPADAALNCNAIQAEQIANAAKIDQDNAAIQSNRQQNEIAGYMAGIFILSMVATESNSEEKDDIATLQQRQDVLRKLIAVKSCNF